MSSGTQPDSVQLVAEDFGLLVEVLNLNSDLTQVALWGKLLKEQMTSASGLKFIRGECLFEKDAMTFVVQAPAGLQIVSLAIPPALSTDQAFNAVLTTSASLVTALSTQLTALNTQLQAAAKAGTTAAGADAGKAAKKEEKAQQDDKGLAGIRKGLGGALGDYIGKTENTATAAKKAFEKAFTGADEALRSFVTTGKSKYKELAQSILSDLKMIAAQQALVWGARKIAGLMGVDLTPKDAATDAAAVAAGVATAKDAKAGDAKAGETKDAKDTKGTTGLSGFRKGFGSASRGAPSCNSTAMAGAACVSLAVCLDQALRANHIVLP